MSPPSTETRAAGPRSQRQKTTKGYVPQPPSPRWRCARRQAVWAGREGLEELNRPHGGAAEGLEDQRHELDLLREESHLGRVVRPLHRLAAQREPGGAATAYARRCPRSPAGRTDRPGGGPPVSPPRPLARGGASGHRTPRDTAVAPGRRPPTQQASRDAKAC
jgi:hypothetical protein